MGREILAFREAMEGIERDMAVSYLSRLVILRGIAPRLGTHRPAVQTKPRVDNRDSLGNRNLILPGGLHWTGKTVHSLQIFGATRRIQALQSGQHDFRLDASNHRGDRRTARR
jgi:hypothetical protein